MLSAKTMIVEKRIEREVSVQTDRRGNGESVGKGKRGKGRERKKKGEERRGRGEGKEGEKGEREEKRRGKKEEREGKRHEGRGASSFMPFPFPRE